MTEMITCVPRDTLKQYLAGWVDESQAAQIEQHLQSCDSCEQTVIELESKPDTVLVPLRQQAPADAAVEPAAELQAAIARAELLVSSTPPSDSPPTLEASHIGSYALLSKLGSGGMGAVYLARHRQLGKQVAIKLLPASWAANDEAAARFRRETLAVGKLNHPAIVNATDAGEQDGAPFLVMEYVDGIDLSQLARAVRPLPIADSCEVVRQAALGLSYAHAEGIVHRDIKPSNIMLDRRGQVKVLDFGLAQLNPWDEVSAELTSVGQLMGTLDYMAPEQAERPSAVDYRADLYALGATLFRLIGGRAPLAAAPNLSPLEKLRLLSDHQPPRLDTLRPECPPQLAQLVELLLARRPDSRPASAAHVAEQLLPFCPGADLVALAARGQSAVATAEHAAKSVYSAPPPVRGEQSRPASLARNSWFRRGLGWLVAAGLLGVVILAGVLIVLETSKGQLVIESEVAGVQVKLLQQGEPIQGFQLETGTTTTRLAADKYQIVLDTPSDAITIDNDQFVLKRGDTVVARIRRKVAEPKSTVAGVTQPPASPQPIYDGKPLDTWLDQLARERSPQALGDAIVAVGALVQEDTAAHITKSLVSVLPKIDGEISFTVGAKDERPSRYSVDQQAFGILRKANPGRGYYELLTAQLAEADAAWGQRILGYGSQVHPSPESIDEMEPLFQWIEDQLKQEQLAATQASLLQPSAALIISLLLNNEIATDRARAELGQRFLPRFAESKYVPAGFWLDLLPTAEWPDLLRQTIVEKAVLALQDSASSAKDIAQAAMILTDALQEKSASASTLDTAEIAAAVRTRLAGLAQDTRRFWQPTAVSYAFREMVIPSIELVSVRSQGSTASESLELLDLAAALKESGREMFDLAPIVELTRARFENVKGLLPTPRQPSSSSGSSRTSSRSMFGGSGRAQFIIDWPELKSFQTVGMPPGTSSLSNLKYEDWLGYFLCTRAAEISGISLIPEDAADQPPKL